jgi:hypothetical protein
MEVPSGCVPHRSTAPGRRYSGRTIHDRFHQDRRVYRGQRGLDCDGRERGTYFVDNPFLTHSCTLGDRSMAAGDERRPPLRLLNSERRYAHAKSVARKSRIALPIPEILLWPEAVLPAGPGSCPGVSHKERHYQSTQGAPQKRAHRFLIAACRRTQHG